MKIENLVLWTTFASWLTLCFIFLCLAIAYDLSHKKFKVQREIIRENIKQVISEFKNKENTTTNKKITEIELDNGFYYRSNNERLNDKILNDFGKDVFYLPKKLFKINPERLFTKIDKLTINNNKVVVDVANETYILPFDKCIKIKFSMDYYDGIWMPSLILFSKNNIVNLAFADYNNYLIIIKYLLFNNDFILFE